MACFLVPAAEAIITTAVQKLAAYREEKSGAEYTVRFSEKIGRLNKMLWGGSALLAFEHVWHGEVTPYFPFLTGAATPESMTAMLSEMSASGVAMALLVTAVWIGMNVISAEIEKRSAKKTASGGTE